MKLFVVKVVNGNISVVSEWSDNEKGACVSFHDTCKTLWNASDVVTARVKILTESLDLFGRYDEIISHEVTE
jgi:hypothetical protein